MPIYAQQKDDKCSSYFTLTVNVPQYEIILCFLKTFESQKFAGI